LKEQADAADALAGEFRERANQLGDELGQTNRQIEAFQADLGILQSSLARVTQEGETRQKQMRSDVDHAGIHLRNLQAQTDRLGTHVNNLQAFVDKHAAEVNATQRVLGERLNDHANDAAFIKGELSEYGALLRGLLVAGGGRKITSRKNGGALDEGEKKEGLGFDSFYLNFENEFRGPRDEIKKRVAFYLPFVRKARAGAVRSPILDVGCGRGEWLELLRENKLEGRGVDINSAMIALCKKRRLKVQLADAVGYLRSLRTSSQGAVTGFHIIEHLPFEALTDLFSQTRRVLKPGGVAIFESPNCKNLVVGACTFYIDPTHRNPVYPETAEFMLASHGFENIEIEYLSPVPNPKFGGTTPELATIRDFLYGPQDFGIIAYKPKKR